MLSASPSPASTVLTSPTGPPFTTNKFDPRFTPSTSQPTTTVFPFLDISSPVTSILPPTPPTSLVSPPPPPGLMLSTPSTFVSHPPIPFQLSTHSTPSTSIIDLTTTASSPSITVDPTLSSLQANLSSHPFIGIPPGAPSEVFMAPKPLSFIPPLPFISTFTPVILPPLSQASSPLPNATPRPLPSLLPTTPSPPLYHIQSLFPLPSAKPLTLLTPFSHSLIH